MKEDKKIKILFRHRSMEMGGVEKVMLSLINNLDREKFAITVLLNLNQGELRDEFPAHVRKLWLVEGREDFSKNPLIQKIQLLKRKKKLENLLKNPKKIDDEVLKEKYDIEIGMTYNDFEPVLASSNKNSRKIGWFHSEINVPGLQPLVPGILSHFPQFDHMVYCSEKIKTLMHEHYPELDYPAESVIINAIPIKEILEKSQEPISDVAESPVPTFVSIGRLHTRKGYHKLISVHKKLLDERLYHRIIVVGDGEERERLQRLIKEKGCGESFKLIGNRMNPYPYLRGADYFILPSESEAWPLVIAEALILKKPVIATDTGDISQMVENYKTGILVDYDEESIYKAMKKFLTDEELVAKIKKNLENSEELFDNQKIYDSVEKLLIAEANK